MIINDQHAHQDHHHDHMMINNPPKGGNWGSRRTKTRWIRTWTLSTSSYAGWLFLKVDAIVDVVVVGGVDCVVVIDDNDLAAGGSGQRREQRGGEAEGARCFQVD